MAVRLSRRGLESCFSRRVPPPSSRPAGKAGGPGDVTAAAAAVSQICTTEFSTHLSDVKKKEKKKIAVDAQNSVTRGRRRPRNIPQDRKRRLGRPETRPNRMHRNGLGLQRPRRRCTHMRERGRERKRERKGGWWWWWGGTHSGRIHWESAESMFYRAIIRLVFGEGVKQTGPVRS